MYGLARTAHDYLIRQDVIIIWRDHNPTFLGTLLRPVLHSALRLKGSLQKLAIALRCHLAVSVKCQSYVRSMLRNLSYLEIESNWTSLS